MLQSPWDTGSRRACSSPASLALVTALAFALGFAPCCTTQPAPSKAPVAADPAEPADAQSPPTALAPIAGNSDHPAPALPAYEPELAMAAPEFTAEDARAVLGALNAPEDRTCRPYVKPLTNLCAAEGPQSYVYVGRLPAVFRSPAAAHAAAKEENETLARIEGCGWFPKGGLRWLRAHRWEQCAVELAKSALIDGGPELDPRLRGLLVGEAIAEDCRRRVGPMPTYRGNFTQERFERWQKAKLAPWQERTQKTVELCHTTAAGLPPGTPGRAAALIGYAQAVQKFVGAHRAAPIPKVFREDFEQRMGYLSALDESTAPLLPKLDAATEEARREASVEGDYAGYASAFAHLVPRQQPLSVLDLPPLPPPGTTIAEGAIARWPVQLSPLRRRAEQPLASQAALVAMLRRGLPQSVRAQVGKELVLLHPEDPARQQLHGLLAAGLLRLGLVTQDRATLERADYELRYAGTTTQEDWLRALTRALLTPGAAKTWFPKFTQDPYPAASRQADSSGFSPELLESAAAQPELAAIAVDHAVLNAASASAEAFFPLVQELNAAARRPGVPAPLSRCVGDWLGRCRWSEFGEDTEGGACDCTPFPWRVN